MQVTVLDKTDSELRLKIAGETHTILNLLKTTLLENKHVEIASYDIKFPNISDPVLFVRTDGADPVKAVIDASKKAVKDCKEFRKVFTEKANI